MSQALNIVGEATVRRTLKILWLTIPVLAGYLAWTFYGRWRDRQAYMQPMEERKAAQARVFQDAYGGDSLMIRSFYAAPGAINLGQTAQLCYSVSNAKSVRMEPPVEYVWPAFSRCVKVSPSKDTVYKFIAEDDKGNTKTASVRVKVVR
jgi:hypothetical protein